VLSSTRLNQVKTDAEEIYLRDLGRASARLIWAVYDVREHLHRLGGDLLGGGASSGLPLGYRSFSERWPPFFPAP